jgi:hypothetical protein
MILQPNQVIAIVLMIATPVVLIIRMLRKG